MTNIHIANATIYAIESTIEADQGATFRGFLGKVIPHIGDAYRPEEESFRTHLGASLLGNECSRSVYLSHRWVTKAKHKGRMVRLFNRGHLEEARFIALLLMIGCKVYQQDGNGKQYRISFAHGHGGGSGDGIATGVPDVPQVEYCLTEFKTHGEKSFIKLAGKNWKDYVDCIMGRGAPVQFTGEGVKESKWTHYVQIQEYLHKFGLAAALYVAVNKNTDEIYCEIIHYDREVAEQYLDLGERLVWMKEPPKKISNSPGFFKCSLCDHKPTCQLGEPAAVNCRTCKYSQPIEGDGTGQWTCSFTRVMGLTPDNVLLSKEEQLAGCHNYEARKF